MDIACFLYPYSLPYATLAQGIVGHSLHTFWLDVFQSCSVRLSESAVIVPGIKGGMTVS